MKRGVAWLIHWFFQGLKLLIFSALALIAAYIVYFPIAIITALAGYNPQTDGLRAVLGVIGMAISLAVFTALLADLLKGNPLRTPAERKAFLDSKKKSQRGSYDSAGHHKSV